MFCYNKITKHVISLLTKVTNGNDRCHTTRGLNLTYFCVINELRSYASSFNNVHGY